MDLCLAPGSMSGPGPIIIFLGNWTWALGSLFCQSKTCKAIALVQRALRSSKEESAYLSDLNFANCEVVTSFSVAMSGSGRQFRAYIVRKVTARPGVMALQLSHQREPPALANSGERNDEERGVKGVDNGATRKAKSNGANSIGDRIRFKKIKKIKRINKIKSIEVNEDGGHEDNRED